ncbi:MAG: ATP-binding cassette domain-containing protein [Spirochaetales bacterium]|nr:ATP-binding cassette domain-containing protein [Spirochaetales bacterium]
MSAENASALLLELRGISASSGGSEILEDVSMTVERGDRVAVMGPSGSGKSTLLKVAAGLEPAGSGHAFFDGRDIATLGQREELDFRKRAGFGFQDGALWENQTVLNNLALPLRIHRPELSEPEIAERSRALLSSLGFTDSLGVRPATLSMGERKIVSIARAIVLEPELVFLDDPTGHLDEDARDRLYAVVDKLVRKGTTIVAVTNNSGFVRRFALRLVVVANGRVTYDVPMKVALAAEGLEPAARSVVARLKRYAERDRLDEIEERR